MLWCVNAFCLSQACALMSSGIFLLRFLCCMYCMDCVSCIVGGQLCELCISAHGTTRASQIVLSGSVSTALK